MRQARTTVTVQRARELSGPPDSAVAEACGLQVLKRRTLRRSALSAVERLTLSSTTGQVTEYILKTTRPELSHERRVYRLLKGFKLCPARLVGDGITREGNPWFMMTPVDEVREIEETDVDAIEDSLRLLAEVHRHFIGTRDRAGVPQWDIAWIMSQWPDTWEVLTRLGSALDLTGLDRSTLQAYGERLHQLRESSRNFPITLVHGDFDPGNLVAARDGIGVLDWGLSHLNTPLIDLAHMVERFPNETRARLSRVYLDTVCLDVSMSEIDAVRTGGLIHRAFFVWWHTMMIDRGWASAEDLIEVVQSRIAEVVA